VAGVALAILALLGLLAWFCWPRRDPPLAREPRPARDDIDRRELEEAEREVQEAPDAESVRDWGPGVQKPPLGR
jgi:hypothetical protein